MALKETKTCKRLSLVDILDTAALIANQNHSNDQSASTSSSPTPPTLETGRLITNNRASKAVTVHKRTKTCNKPARKHTRKKPKDKPKRPLSAYNLFFQSERERILKHGKIGFADLARNIAAKWKNLDDEAKSPFQAKAAVEKLRYKSEVEVWKRTHESNWIRSSSMVEKQQMHHHHHQRDASSSVLPVAPVSCDAITPSAVPLDDVRSEAAAMPSPIFSTMMHEDPHGISKPITASLNECLAATQWKMERATAILDNPILQELYESPHQFGCGFHGMQQSRSVQQTTGIPSPPVSNPSQYDAALDFSDFHPVEDGELLLLPRQAEPCPMEQEPHRSLEKVSADKKSESAMASLLDEFVATLDEDLEDFLTEFGT